MGVSEGCFLLGISLLRVSTAAELAAWAAAKNRPLEAVGFLEYAKMDISKALASDLITEDDAEKMRGHLAEFWQAMEEYGKGKEEKMEEAQDSLAALTVKSHDLAFQKVVACELKYRR